MIAILIPLEVHKVGDAFHDDFDRAEYALGVAAYSFPGVLSER